MSKIGVAHNRPGAQPCLGHQTDAVHRATVVPVSAPIHRQRKRYRGNRKRGHEKQPHACSSALCNADIPFAATRIVTSAVIPLPTGYPTAPVLPAWPSMAVPVWETAWPPAPPSPPAAVPEPPSPPLPPDASPLFVLA